jgi:HAE1 family hydrophobic/amphiphilic exporter-1
MQLSDLCIRRPVFATMLCAVPIVLGVVSYTRLGVDLQPKLDLPYVFITTTLRGASVEEVETRLTRPIEEAVNTIEGIDELRSMSGEGVSRVFVRFVLEKDPDVAAQEVQNKINAMVAQLPRGTMLPVIDKLDEDAAPVVTVVVSGRRDLREVTEIARRRVKESIETIGGVGQVAMVGDRRRTIEVIVDPARLEQFGLAIDHVRQALTTQNLELPGGRVEQGPRELVLRVLGRYDTAARFEQLVVATRGGYPIRVKDVGRAVETVEDPRGLARLDGVNAVCLIVRKQSGANTVEVVHKVKERLEQIGKALPPDFTLKTVRDQSIFIERSIEEVQFHLLLAASLVAATILLFIRDWRTTLIATSAIPASIIATFACMDGMGFTLNNITMLALVLAIGIVIDDAVVVHENIFRHMEEHGRDAMEASRIGTSEIALAVLATSLSLVVIFVPIAFMEGQTGRLFNSFGLTIAFAILMSLFVSFSLTPMLCSRFLKVDAGGHSSKSGWLYCHVEGGYARLLDWSLRHKGTVALLSLALVASGYPLLKATSLEYIPKDDTNEFEVMVIAPPGSTLDRMSRQFAEFEARLKKLPGVTSTLTTIGDTSGRVTGGAGDVTRGTIYVQMIDLTQRDYSQFDVMRQARDMLREYPDYRVTVSPIDPLRTGSSGFSVDLNLVGPDLKVLEHYTFELVNRLRKVPGLVDVDTTLAVNKPELHVELDRARAADLGVTAETVASSMAVLVGGEPISTFKDSVDQYDVWLRAVPDRRSRSERIAELRVPAEGGQLIPLGSLAQLTERVGPQQIERLNRQRRTTVGGNLDGISTGDAVNAMMREANAMGMPPGYEVRKGMRSRSLDEVASNFLLAFGLSLVFMYMVLAAQFESFTDPITILLALPLTFPFALLSLQILRQSMDIYAIFGLFMLVGIVKKNGILQVDYTNELRRRGVPRDAAILQANRTRLRPILMTTLMLVAGMVPIALGRGPGSAARASLANVIIGGQMLSLLPTLLVTPVAYALIDDLRNRRRRRPTAAEPMSDPEAASPASGEIAAVAGASSVGG